MYTALHGHSYYSDGLNSPEELVNYAAHNNITYLALTDHKNVNGIPEFYQSAQKNNQSSNPIVIPIAGIESKPPQGEIIFLKPTTFDKLSPFLEWATHIDPQSNYIELASHALQKLQCLIIIPHPHLTPHSLKCPDIEKLYQSVPQQFHKQIAIEIHNGASSFLGKLNYKREKTIINFCKSHGYNMLANPDYHHVKQMTIGLSHCQITAKKPSYEHFIQCFMNQKLEPIKPELSPIEKVTQISILTRAFFKDHFNI